MEHSSITISGKTISKNELFIDNSLLSSELHHFLKDWFSKKEFICVKTSGSTGSPKTIKLSKEKMIASAIKTGNFLKLNPGDKALCCLPIDYIAGKMMVVRSIVLGLDLTIAKPSKSPFSKLSSNYDFSACTPHQLEGSTKNLSKIKILLIGGSPVNETLKKQLQDCKNTIYETFGMTETISHIALKNITANEQNFKALEGVSFESIEGCLKITCPDLLKKPLITNDLVEMFSEKEFSWIGRKDFVVNSGGIKLFPEKIEKKLSKFLKDPFLVIGIPDESLGEKLVIVFEGKVSKYYQKALESLNKYEKPKRSFEFIKFKRLNNKVLRNEVLKKVLKINGSKQ